MKKLKIYAFLTFLFLGSTTVSAQSMFDLYFDKASHNGVRHNAQSYIFIKDWFSKL